MNAITEPLPHVRTATSRVVNSIGLLGFALAAALACSPAVAGEAIEPGKITCTPTWACMGINWHFTGDDTGNAKVTTEYRRKGQTAWREALPLWRHEYGKTRMFSGSVLRLCPGTEYDFRLTASDKDLIDGEKRIVKTVSARTLDYPALPQRVVAVPEGGLVAAQAKAQPGTIMLLGKGEFPGTTLNKPGKPGEWIVYKGAPGGRTVITSRIEIRADYVWLHGLTVRDPKNAIQGSHKGVCITNCKITSHYAIHTHSGGGSHNYFIADNVLTGDSKGKFAFGGEGVDFGSDRGRCGNAVCFNELTDFADGISYGRGDIDVYNNFIHETVDDFIEPDYARENYRLWNNRCYNSMCGFSFQPQKGGPWYMFDNVNVGTYLHCLKVKDVTGANVIVNNTFLTKTSRIGHGLEIIRGWILNNVWLRTTPGSLASGGGGYRPRHNPTRVDYNAYGTGGGPPWPGSAYTALTKKLGWDRHSIQVDYKELFNEKIEPPTGNPRYWSGITGHQITKDWQFNHPLLTPRADAKIVDAGTVLPNLTGPYLGKSRDMGAQEAGLGAPWYGPRTWDEKAGIIYGLPTGWKKLPVASAAKYAALGCPAGAKSDVLLAGEKPQTYALIRGEKRTGESRWKRAKELVADAKGARTKVLEFQDGLYVRLYVDGDNARLVAARVEARGVLHAVTGCKKADLPKARLAMFQFVRSLVR